MDMTLDERIDEWLDWRPENYDHQLVTDMKNELAALRAENERLREALQRIADAASGWEGRKEAPYWNVGDITITAARKEGMNTYPPPDDDNPPIDADGNEYAGNYGDDDQSWDDGSGDDLDVLGWEPE